MCIRDSSNAFKYTEVGESITVKLYIEGDNLFLQVIDTGIGIPLEKQEKIFEDVYKRQVYAFPCVISASVCMESSDASHVWGYRVEYSEKG